MSSNVAQVLLDARKMFSGIIDELSKRQNELSASLLQLEEELTKSRTAIKDKDLEINRLKEIVKTQEYSLAKQFQKVEKTELEAESHIEKLNESVNEIANKIQQIFAHIDTQPDYSQSIEVLNSKIDQLPSLADKIEVLASSINSVSNDQSQQPVDDADKVIEELNALRTEHAETLHNLAVAQTKVQSYEKKIYEHLPEVEIQNKDQQPIETPDQFQELSDEKIYLKNDKEALTNSLEALQQKLKDIEHQSLIKNEENHNLKKIIFELQTQLDKRPSSEKVDIKSKDWSNIQDPDDLKLRIAEYELEEANWHDEKKELQNKLESLRIPQENSGALEKKKIEVVNLKERILKLENRINSLKDVEIKAEKLYNIFQKVQRDKNEKEKFLKNIDHILSRILPITAEMSWNSEASDKLEDKTSDSSSEELLESSLNRTVAKASLYSSLIDKFLKPQTQITYLVKQGEWELESLAEIIGIDQDEIIPILEQLKSEDLINFNLATQRVWSKSD